MEVMGEVMTPESAGFSTEVCQMLQRVYDDIAGPKNDVARKCTRMARAVCAAAIEFDLPEVVRVPINGDFALQLGNQQARRVFHTWLRGTPRDPTSEFHQWGGVIELSGRQFMPDLPTGPIFIPSRSWLCGCYLGDAYLGEVY